MSWLLQTNYCPNGLIIGEEFCKLYYNKISQGINQVFGLFSPDATCTIDGQEVKGSYNFLLTFTNGGITKLEYYNITGTTQIVNNDILIVVNGNLRAIGFWGQTSYWFRFSETFVLGNTGGNNYVIKNYVFKTVN
jgi:hypothetical protein